MAVIKVPDLDIRRCEYCDVFTSMPYVDAFVIVECCAEHPRILRMVCSECTEYVKDYTLGYVLGYYETFFIFEAL